MTVTVDSDALTQFSGSLSDQEQNGAVHMNQEESIMGQLLHLTVLGWNTIVTFDDDGEAVSQNACQASQTSLSVYFNHKYAMPKVTVYHRNDMWMST